jgi:hypothetical protein
MVMTKAEVEMIASELWEIRCKERKRLETLRAYLLGKPSLTWLPTGQPREVQALARTSRVNLMPLVVKGTTQQLFLGGYVSSDTDAATDIWGAWRLNQMPRKEIGLHKAASGYGVAYAVSVSGDPVPVMKPVSPLKMTTAYGDSDDWPLYALEELSGGRWRLLDGEAVYPLARVDTKRSRGSVSLVFELAGEPKLHGAAVCPVVRYLADEDLDDPVTGDVEPLIPIQDQMNITTFHLLLAQHYGAAGRKVIIGKMVRDLERQFQQSGANTTMTISANPEDVRVEEISQTDLTGFIDSRKAQIELVAAIGQTPVWELMGNLANLAAAALEEARESNDRKVEERKTTFGASHTQLLGLAGQHMGFAVDPFAEVRWRNARPTRARALVDLLVTVSEKLGVPSEALLDKLPFSEEEIARYRRAVRGEPEPDAASGEAPTEEEGDGAEVVAEANEQAGQGV